MVILDESATTACVPSGAGVHPDQPLREQLRKRLDAGICQHGCTHTALPPPVVAASPRFVLTRGCPGWGVIPVNVGVQATAWPAATRPRARGIPKKRGHR